MMQTASNYHQSQLDPISRLALFWDPCMEFKQVQTQWEAQLKLQPGVLNRPGYGSLVMTSHSLPSMVYILFTAFNNASSHALRPKSLPLIQTLLLWNPP